MIVSHKHKFIFLRTHKTAGASMEIALSSICGPDDIISRMDPRYEMIKRNLGYRPNQHVVIPQKYGVVKNLFSGAVMKEYYHHMWASQIKQTVEPDVWASYYKFCFDRNPFDKVISLYYWVEKRDETLTEFIQSPRVRILKTGKLYSIEGIPAMDTVYKYEEMDAALDDLTEKFELKQPLRMPNFKVHGDTRKDKRHYNKILNQEQVDLISEKFADELSYLSYSF